jgi:hypothetical protein
MSLQASECTWLESVSKRLHHRFTIKEVENVVFSEKKIFYLQEQLNSQNDKVCALSIEDVPPSIQGVQRFQSSKSIRVAVSSRGKMPIAFISSGIKINKNYYLKEVLQKVLKPAGTSSS